MKTRTLKVSWYDSRYGYRTRESSLDLSATPEEIKAKALQIIINDYLEDLEYEYSATETETIVQFDSSNK